MNNFFFILQGVPVMKRLRYGLMLVMSIVVLASCSKDDDPVAPTPTANPTFASSSVKEGAVYFSFDSKKEVTQWDLRFAIANGRSPEFYLNSAKLGNTNVMIYNSEATDFAAVNSFDQTKFSLDKDTAITGGKWYSYDPTNHTLSSKGLVYLVQTCNDNVIKFQVKEYDNKAATLTVQYALYDAATKKFGEANMVVINPATEKFLSFAKGLVENAGAWDVKLTTVLIQPEGSPSAVRFPAVFLNTAGNVMAKAVTGKEFDAVDAKAETGLATDTDSKPIIGAEWFDYASDTHRITSKKTPYVVQTANGKRTKFRIKNYYNDSNVSGYITLEYTNAQ